MGLLYPLLKEQNRLYFDFNQAYWAIEDLSYDTTTCYFRLAAYPSREARQRNMTILSNPTIGFGGTGDNVVKSQLYIWEVELAIAGIFPAGIPISPDEQKTVIYNWIKGYTQLPFADVIE